MESVLILIGIILAVYLGNKFAVNTGILALGFAYLIGAFVVGMSPSDLLGIFPTKLFMVIFGLSMFFNFAVVNGTLDKLAKLLLYYARNFTKYLPILIYLISALVSGLGAGFFATVAVMTTIAMAISNEAGLNRLLAAISISLGALSGANFMVSSHGVIFSSLLSETALVGDSQLITHNIFWVTFLYPFFVLLFLIFMSSRSNQAETIQAVFKKPEAFTPKQKLNLLLIGLFMAIILFVPILSRVFSGNTVLEFVNSRIDISFLAIVFAIVGYLTHLAEDSKAVTANVPWNTIWLVTGMSMLISVAAEAGTIELLASAIAQMPDAIIPIAITIIAGIMSMFSSTIGVVAPLMFPMVAEISGASGHSATLLIIAVIVGAQSTAISPFSSGGSLALGNSMLVGEEQDQFFKDLLFKATPLGLICSTLTIIILMFFI
ncbi:SLC13 family permease [Aerococcaceae bacterium DSM 111021]|nr:SLC13 family permease [Aerococcaceae bacterium DSM 111021]